ncbi:MAG TPA: hypothetical protein VNV43_14490 [Candidatus Acidoferrales bacterium]|nr:hypothetical protein [Candidatus Acidoferrales bacterium]
MTFQDMQLQQCYDAHLGKVGNALGDLGPVYALVATHNWFAMLEGTHSVRVHETIDLLLSTEMRPALRHWYGRSGLEMDSIAVEFRNHLSRLAGERLESTPEILLNPS